MAMHKLRCPVRFGGLTCLFLAGMTVGVLLWIGPALAETPAKPVVLEVLNDQLSPRPGMSEESNIGLVGIVAARAPQKGVAMTVDILIPAPFAGAGGPLCVQAHSQDSRYTFEGQTPHSGWEPNADGRVRVTGNLKPESRRFLQGLDLSQLALIARDGACTTPVNSSATRFFAVDPWPGSRDAVGAVRVLLNASADPVSLRYGSRGAATKKEIPCRTAVADERSGFGLECLIDATGTDVLDVEILTHRFKNEPLVDQFILVPTSLRRP